MNPNVSVFNRMCVYVFLAMAGLGFFGLYGLAVSFFVSYWIISYVRAVKRRNELSQGQNGQKLP